MIFPGWKGSCDETNESRRVVLSPVTAGYYDEHLSAERLRRCYEIAPARVQQYLRAEIAYVASKIQPSDQVLELGCGYGRVLKELAAFAAVVVGIDTSPSSLRVATEWLQNIPNIELERMSAIRLAFADRSFDVVLCIQNGLSAFGVARHIVLREALRVTKRGGRVLLSSYAAGFWPHRLEWFRLQSEAGLLGEIDWSTTGDGVIVCRDGFRAETISPEEFKALAANVRVPCRIEEVDGSSLFCELLRYHRNRCPQ